MINEYQMTMMRKKTITNNHNHSLTIYQFNRYLTNKSSTFQQFKSIMLGMMHAPDSTLKCNVVPLERKQIKIAPYI